MVSPKDLRRRRRPRKTLAELLAAYDPSVPRTDEDQAWLDMGCVGAERFWEPQRPMPLKHRLHLSRLAGRQPQFRK